LAVLAEAHFLLHGWLRSGNCGAARGAVEFLKEALALWGQRQKIRLLRADSGFFEDNLLSFLEERCLPYIVVARLTQWIKRQAQSVVEWKPLDAHYAVGEFRLKLLGWQRERRFVAVRELVREDRESKGRKLIDVPGYTFRIFVTSREDAPEEIWREYNRRADMENRIAELKRDLGADGFCLKKFQPPKPHSGASFCCSTSWPSSNGRPAYPDIGSPPRSALKFSPVARFSDVPAAV